MGSRLVIALGILGVAAGLGRSATIDVAPGPGTPLQDALAAASPGDTVRLLPGTFAEALTIDKAIRLRGAGALATTIDAVCGAPYAIDVAAGEVHVESLTVQGGTAGGVRVQGVRGVRLREVRALAFRSVPGQHCGTESYGIDVDGATRVKLERCAAVGTFWQGDQSQYVFGTAGVRLANLPPRAGVRVKQSSSVGNPVGVLVENADGPGLRIVTSITDALDAGVLLRNTRGAVVKRNSIGDADSSNPPAGIRLDPASSANLVVSNVVRGAMADVLDEGSGNCWRRNDFVTGVLPADNCP